MRRLQPLFFPLLQQSCLFASEADVQIVIHVHLLSLCHPAPPSNLLSHPALLYTSFVKHTKTETQWTPILAAARSLLVSRQAVNTGVT